MSATMSNTAHVARVARPSTVEKLPVLACMALITLTSVGLWMAIGKVATIILNHV